MYDSIVYKSTVKNMVMVQNVEIIPQKFNVSRICTSVTCSSQEMMMMMMMTTAATMTMMTTTMTTTVMTMMMTATTIFVIQVMVFCFVTPYSDVVRYQSFGVP